MKKGTKIFLLIWLCFIPLVLAEDTSEKVVITGETMELKDRGNTTIFRGGVKLQRGNSTLLGDEMHYNKRKGFVEITGNVLLRFRSPQGETVYAKGKSAEYNEKDGTGHIGGNPEIVRTARDEIGQINLYADDLYFDDVKEEVRASGNVHIIQYQTESRSHEALFKNKEDTLILSGGNPVLLRKDSESMGEYHGDTITILYRENKVILEKNVRGWIRLAREKQKPEETREPLPETESERKPEQQDKEQKEK